MRRIEKDVPVRLRSPNGSFRMPLDASIGRLGLPPHIKMKLEAVGIATISDLARLSKSDLRAIAKLKGSVLATIVECMRESGRALSAVDTVAKAKRGRPFRKQQSVGEQPSTEAPPIANQHESDFRKSPDEEVDGSRLELQETAPYVSNSNRSGVGTHEAIQETEAHPQRRSHPKDDERATRYATRKNIANAPILTVQRTAKRSSDTGTESTPAASVEDDKRIAALRRTTTMDADDAAYLYSVPREAIYAACRRGEIPHRKFGTRLKVLTRPVFIELGLE